MKQLLMIFVMITVSCTAVHDNIDYYSVDIQDKFINRADFMLGWYISNDEKMLDFAIRNSSNPYADFYNTYIVYSHNKYNKEDDLYSLNPRYIHSYSDIYPHINFIADLPRYSTLYRNIMVPGNREHNKLSHPYIDTYMMDENFIQLDYPYSPDVYRTYSDSVLYIYDFSKSYPNYGVIYLTEEFFAGKGNASVYRHAHMLDFASKRLDYHASLCIVINAETDAGSKTLFITDNQKWIKPYSKRTGIDPDTIIYVDILPSWHVNTVDIAGILPQSYIVKDMTIISDNILLGPFVFKYSFDCAFNICRHFIDNLYSADNIIGFYSIDEIQYKEMLCLDRWADQSPTEKSSYTLLELVERIDHYVMQKGKPSFALSSAGFHDITGFAMNEDRYENISRHIRIFDTYSYRDDYVNALLSAVHENSDVFNVIVNDAYSTSSRKALPFYLTKFKFFLPLIAGVDGMIFYTYALPRVYSRNELMNDTSKVNVGELSEYTHIYNIFNMYRHSCHFVLEDKNRMSVVMDGDSIILFMYAAIKGHENYYNPSGSSVYYDLSAQDKDIDYLLSLLDSENYIITDISPYSANRYITSDTLFCLSYFSSTHPESIADMMNNYPFNTLLNIYDIRIIAVLKGDYYADFMFDESSERILFPQLVMPGSLVIDDSIMDIRKTLNYMQCLEDADFTSILPLPEDNNSTLLFRDFSGRQFKR